MKPDQLYARVCPSVLTLEVVNLSGRRFVGSGFLALGDGLAVTAWHLIHDARRVQAHFSDGTSAEVVGLIDKNEKLDLALLQIKCDRRPQLKVAARPPVIGTRIYVVGSPGGFEFTLSEGLIGQIRSVDEVRYYQLSCPISPGDSGGPVLNERGEAVGVVSWRKADAQSLGFAIPAQGVAALRKSGPPQPWPIVASSPGAAASAAAP